MFRIKRILVAVDFSDASRDALEYARFLGSQFDAQVDVVHVVEPAFRGSELMTHIPGQPDETFDHYVQRHAADELKHWVLIDREDAPVTTRVVAGMPDEEIVKLATEGNYDLVVMGTVGRRGMEYILVGSTAARVVRTAPCPVVTVRAGKIPGRAEAAA